MSLAGVTMNLIVAVILSFVTKGIALWYYTSGGSALLSNIYLIFYYAVMINLVLMIFNLIPVPPLDGWGIITQIFNLEKYDWWYTVYRNGQWILLILIFTHATSYIITPCVSGIMDLLGMY